MHARNNRTSIHEAAVHDFIIDSELFKYDQALEM